MKHFLTAVLVLSALTLGSGAAKARARAATQGTIQPEPAPKKRNAPPKAVVLGGKINDDGTIFISDKDLKSWKVTDPDAEAVKAHRNEHVTINAIQNPRTGSVTVQSARRRNVKISATP